MPVIKVLVRNQRLSLYNLPVVASNSYDYLKVQATFVTSDWADVDIKTINFNWKGYNKQAVLDEDNQCYVPKEVIRSPGFQLSIFGGGITTNQVKVPVINSGIDPDIMPNFSLELYEELIERMQNATDKLEASKADNIIRNEEDNTIQLSANGKPIGDKIEMCNCGIKSFDVDENDNITITLLDGRVIDLGHIAGASGATFIPHISDDKILTWTNDKDLPNPEPVDLNPFDEWGTLGEEENSDYVWENLV